MKMQNQEIKGISVVIPAYNEEGGIIKSLKEVKDALKSVPYDYEILVVDDGSEDNTADLIEKEEGVKLIQAPENRGYGASLKMGIRQAMYEIIVITDADGTYPADAIPKLVESLAHYDMVVGARIGDKVSIPTIRRPAKWFLTKLASYLAERHIPDLNSGLRVIRRSLVQRFEHLLPSGFSFTTTITLASLCTSCLVAYVPINYYARIGTSKIRPSHAFDFLLLIIRTIVYFNPLKIFLPLGALFFAGGFSKFVYDVYIGNLSESALLGIMGAALLWAVGLISDQIARLNLRPTRY